MGKWTNPREAVLIATGGDGGGFIVLPLNSIDRVDFARSPEAHDTLKLHVD